jgi:hypothetical protein
MQLTLKDMPYVTGTLTPERKSERQITIKTAESQEFASKFRIVNT